MKQALIIGVFLFVCSGVMAASVERMPPEVTTEPTPEPVKTEAQAPEEEDYDSGVIIDVLLDGEVRQLTLQDYLAGVLSAEMPAAFEPEALKAQAVAARTNVLRKLEKGWKHENAVVCGDSTCCMGYEEPDSEVYLQAVMATDGEVARYEGGLIDAVFFSGSWGRTEDAVAVWGSDVPYLVSVESPEEERCDSVELSLTDFCTKLLSVRPEADISEAREPVIVRDEAGAVATLSVGGVELTGREARSLFGLRSACFELELSPAKAIFTTHGYGHGVGLSQYGANAMAADGSSYEDILKWYYTGVEVEKMEK